MKFKLTSLAFLASLGSLFAELQEAYMIMPDETFSTIYLESADEKRVAYRETRQSVDRKVIARSKYSSLYIFEPASFRQAMDDFRRFDYEKAIEGFKTVQEDYANLRDLPNNFASRAEFYECECLRLMGKYDEMVKLKATYRFKNLLYTNEKRQLELYKFWEAVQNKSWQRLVTLGKEYMEKPLPGPEKAQVAYCYGLALGEMQQLNPALNALGMAVTADFNPHKEMSRMAMVRSLELLYADPDFQRELAAWGTDDAIEGSSGQARILEAGRIAKYYNSIFVTGPKIDKKYSDLISYLPDDEKPEGEE